MPLFHNNRLLAFALCIALSLSSIGLPVVIATCGIKTVVMTKSCMMSSGEHDTSVQRISSPPCRMQVFFVERNSTVYLPAKSVAHVADMHAVLVLPVCSHLAGTISSSSVKPQTSPPFVRDNIPILTSALLI